MHPIRTTLSADDDPALQSQESREPALFLMFERDRLAAGTARYLLGDIQAVHVGRGPERRAVIEESAGTRRLSISLPDSRISTEHFCIRRSGGGWELADAGAMNGTFVNGERMAAAFLADGDLIEAGRTFFYFRRNIPRCPGCTSILDATSLELSTPGFATLVPQLETELARLRAICDDDLSICIQGETGTGKELLAAAVHKLSGRPGLFLALNCGALPSTLIASELFGYRKGAFSGADEDRPGLFRSADQGTLFLDEIGDLPLEAQAALLRALQEKEVLPIGATRPVKVDVRVVCATSRDLGALAREGRFRRDLYERVAGYTTTLPALRDRVEDIGLIVMALLRKVDPGGDDDIHLTADAARALLRYDWPGNVRELENCLRAALLLAGRAPIALSHLAAGPRQALDLPRRCEPGTAAPAFTDAQLKRRDELVTLLATNAGNVSAVARILGKDRVQIQRWLKRLDVDVRTFRR